MISSKESQHVYFDCDDTLVMWDYDKIETPLHKQVNIVCDEVWPGGIFLKKNAKNIEALINCRLKGHTIIVWSAAGADWAKAVVQGLGLERYVHFTLGKPNIFYDDLNANDILQEIHRFYNKDE